MTGPAPGVRWDSLQHAEFARRQRIGDRYCRLYGMVAVLITDSDPSPALVTTTRVASLEIASPDTRRRRWNPGYTCSDRARSQR
jgi:hypothetical protein